MSEDTGREIRTVKWKYKNLERPRLKWPHRCFMFPPLIAVGQYYSQNWRRISTASCLLASRNLITDLIVIFAFVLTCYVANWRQCGGYVPSRPINITIRAWHRSVECCQSFLYVTGIELWTASRVLTKEKLTKESVLYLSIFRSRCCKT